MTDKGDQLLPAGVRDDDDLLLLLHRYGLQSPVKNGNSCSKSHAVYFYHVVITCRYKAHISPATDLETRANFLLYVEGIGWTTHFIHPPGKVFIQASLILWERL